MREYAGPNTLLKAFQLIRQAIKSMSFTVGDGLSKEGDTLSVTTPVRSIVTQAEFDALPEEQRSSGLYVISDGGSGGGTTGEVYSTEETRIGTWIVIDGKTAEIPSGGGVTMEQVNAAIDEAITGAIEEVYYGTDSSAEAPVQ